MSTSNPYAYSPAAEAPVAERAVFLQKTYALLLAGIFVFAGTLWAVPNVPVVGELAARLWSNRWIPLVVLFGAAFLVHAVAEKRPINLVVYFAYAFLFGLILAPLVLITASGPGGAAVLTQASIVTAMVFTGLTGYVFLSKRDFSFLGGALAIGLFALIGIGLAGMIFGFEAGLWYSVAGVVLFSGYVLYDTSRILHHYPTTAHVSAAIVLFVDVVLLFKHLLILLSNRD
ncbi:MAG: US12 family protein [Planctomycetes bacterium]|nr:US12 family protein [Planctomycetota bacterium]